MTPERDAWLRPLMDAAQRGKGKGRKATFITPWVQPDGSLAPEHEPYAVCLCGAMGRNHPWLLPLLREAAACVYAAPGTFLLVLPGDRSRTRYPVPEMVPHTYMLPWVCDAEREMPQ